MISNNAVAAGVSEPAEQEGAALWSSERRLLALDALFKLNRQFSQSPDFEELLRVLLLSLSGQFTTPSTFALMVKPLSANHECSFLGTGKFRDNCQLAQIKMPAHEFSLLVSSECTTVMRVGSDLPGPRWLKELLTETGVELVCFVVHNGRNLGMIGLGRRIGGSSLTDDDVGLLSNLIQTISPFLVSSYLYCEIAGISSWYAGVINSVAQGLFIFDCQNKLKKLNAVAFTILNSLGRNAPNPEDLVGLGIEDLFPEPVYESWISKLTDLKTNHGIEVQHLKARSQDGERFFHVRLSLTSAGAGEKPDMIIVIDDVTKQRDSEQRLFELQKFADKGVMVSSIAHELNNFLAVVLGGIEMSQMAFRGGDSERALANLEKVKTNAARMERFTAGLMDFTKLGSSKGIADLNSLTRDAISFAAVQKRFKKISLRTALDSELPSFEMDSDQICQLLLNLLNNAADAINESDRDDGVIEISTAVHGKEVALGIRDNGCGMPPEVKERLFKEHLTTKPSGHGYGLVTCAKIIEQHQASVQIDSTIGAGTFFRVLFPLSLPAQQ